MNGPLCGPSLLQIVVVTKLIKINNNVMNVDFQAVPHFMFATSIDFFFSELDEGEYLTSCYSW